MCACKGCNPKYCDCNIIHEETVKKVLKDKPDEIEFNCLSELFKILGDKTRLKIVWTLDREEMCVSDIANVLNMTKSSISHQLATLKEVGIVKCRKDGKEVIYKLDDGHIKLLYEIGLEHIEHKIGENK